MTCKLTKLKKSNGDWLYFEKALALMEHTKEKMRFSRYRVFHVVQKHYLGDVEIKTAI